MFDFHVWEGIKRPFPLIGQARIKWCRHHVVFSFVQHNKSPLLLKRLLQLLRSSPSHQTTRLTNGLTQTILEQCLDRAYFCVDSIMQILGAYCRNMYVPQICCQITLLVYFFGTPCILFSCPVIKICVAKLRDIYIIVKRRPVSILVWI